MSGVKGMVGSGGRRSGAGRKPKPKMPEVPMSTDGVKRDPLTFLLDVMNDAEIDKRLRVRAAVAAAQYTNIKKSDGGKKEGAVDKARKIGEGRFAAAQGPRLVVDNKRPAAR